MPDPVKHVVVLALENHSFDQMLGCFKKLYPGLEGVDLDHPCSNCDTDGRIYSQAVSTARSVDPDPKHEFRNVQTQLDHGGKRCSGFVYDYSREYPHTTAFQRQEIINYYDMGSLPALHALAKDFTICDHWFSSLPGPTWPNRFFLLTGTSNGYVDMPDTGNLSLHCYDQDSIFDRLTEQGISWNVYFHDIPQTLFLRNQWSPKNHARYRFFRDFRRAAEGSSSDFPQFAFIEPQYSGDAQNDDHPPFDVINAQALIAEVYNALRGNERLWRETLLIVVYDEHGGFFDHVFPPHAVPPDECGCEQFKFDRLGVRVPAVLVSPWVERTYVPTIFDHTSILSYLTRKWSLRPLTMRSVAACSFASCIRQTGEPRTDVIEKISIPEDLLNHSLAHPPAGQINANQRALAEYWHKWKDKIATSSACNAAKETLGGIAEMYVSAAKEIADLLG